MRPCTARTWTRPFRTWLRRSTRACADRDRWQETIRTGGHRGNKRIQEALAALFSLFSPVRLLVRSPGPKMKDEASYNCDSCGEEIVVPIDLTAGSSQEYVEDCPVCCRPNVIHVEIDDGGDVRVWAERE